MEIIIQTFFHATFCQHEYDFVALFERFALQ